MLFLFHCHISSALRGIRRHLLYWMLPNGPSMHCGPRYRHYNDICFLFKVQPFPCGKTRLQITVFRMCGISCESWHNVFPLSLQQTVPPILLRTKAKEHFRSFSFKQSPLHLTTDYSTQKPQPSRRDFNIWAWVKTEALQIFQIRPGHIRHSSKNIDRSAGFLSSASPLLHHLITKTIYKKSAPSLQRDRPVFLLQKRYTSPASI